MTTKRNLRCILILLLFFKENFVQTETKVLEGLREKRQINSLPLMFPYGANYKLVLGFAIPVPNRDKINLAFAANFQYQYAQFQNVTELSQYYFIKEVSRDEKRSLYKNKINERITFYKALENLFHTQGLQGRDCVLRTICEAAQFPVENEGLVGEIMHILLTPDYGHTPFDDPDPSWVVEAAAYRQAAAAGRQMFSCPDIYTGCPPGKGDLDLVTTLRDY